MEKGTQCERQPKCNRFESWWVLWVLGADVVAVPLRCAASLGLAEEAHLTCKVSDLDNCLGSKTRDLNTGGRQVTDLPRIRMGQPRRTQFFKQR